MIYKQKYKNNEIKFTANDEADNSFETKNPVPQSAVDNTLQNQEEH